MTSCWPLSVQCEDGWNPCHVSVWWSFWRVLLTDDLVVHQITGRSPTHPNLEPSTYTSPSPNSQGPWLWLCQAFRSGISTLISHLWHSNELRLLIHLWDPPDYQTGGRSFVNCKRRHLCCWPSCQGEWNQTRDKRWSENEIKAVHWYSLRCPTYSFI